MSETQILARGSKTAAVVVLVVFLQLLVIAVLGLGAITRDRREGAREARQRADDLAIGTAKGNVTRFASELKGLLQDVMAVSSPEQLRYFQRTHGTHGAILDAAFQVDADGVVYWFTGKERLWLPLLRSESLEDQSVQGEDDIKRLEGSYLKAANAGDHALAVSQLRLLVDRHALKIGVEGDQDYPAGVAWAEELVKEAADPDGQVTPEVFREALLMALETSAINAGRPQFSPSDKSGRWQHLRQLDRVIDERLLCEANQEELGFLVTSFRHAWSLLEKLRDPLDAGVKRYQALAKADEAVPRVLEVKGELLALARSPAYATRVAVARLDPESVRRMASDGVDEAGLARQGVRLAFVRNASALEPHVLDVQDLAREGELEVPFRAVLYRDQPVDLPSGGPTEGFYLGIIALAAMGLLVGGAVLVRLWRREVRLARLKADFVSNLSHELKTPLTSISLFTEMLREGKLASDEERNEGLAILAQESQRLQRIVARMIDVARHEARGTPYDLAPGDLNAPVREAALRFRRIVTEPGLDLVVSTVPEALPVLMDPAAVDDAVTNLLSNAWKYKRGDRARIEVRTRRRRGKAEIVVSDDGIGIPRHERKRVFEMFYRAENYLTRTVAGTGLGLALVRTIVRAHRGRIRIEPGLGGVGSTFRVRMPLTRRPLAPDSPAPRSTAAAAPLPSHVESPS